ncbi:MAG: MerR family transcriptional regulator [Peptococcaceae bacterium BICA1-7]|nr:MAG: MerR family transcriptional regulator [Peptococcaceae bacterium BICA1-7]HBV98206.1 MerR family DNA-binding transcriptional regulator [Desulfotomaculum sp.]
MKQYRIGEVAEKAGLSKRTIDYYTNLGLLKSVRSESNYRYYSEEAIIRLKIIENMKSKRYTLEEIREHIAVLDEKLGQSVECSQTGGVDRDFLIGQIKQLEEELALLEPVLANVDSGQGSLQVKQKLIQSMTLIHVLIIYINEMAALV